MCCLSNISLFLIFQSEWNLLVLQCCQHVVDTHITHSFTGFDGCATNVRKNDTVIQLEKWMICGQWFWCGYIKPSTCDQILL